MLPQEMGCGGGMTCWRRLRDLNKGVRLPPLPPRLRGLWRGSIGSAAWPSGTSAVPTSTAPYSARSLLGVTGLRAARGHLAGQHAPVLHAGRAARAAGLDEAGGARPVSAVPGSAVGRRRRRTARIEVARSHAALQHAGRAACSVLLDPGRRAAASAVATRRRLLRAIRDLAPALIADEMGASCPTVGALEAAHRQGATTIRGDLAQGSGYDLPLRAGGAAGRSAGYVTSPGGRSERQAA
jgi:hypothetical protein